MKAFCLLTLVIFCFSCQKDEGQWMEKKIPTGDFNILLFKEIFDITLMQDTTNYVVVGAGENLIQNISIEIKDGVLECNQVSETNWNRSYRHTKLEIHFKELTKIQIDNCVNLKSVDTLKINTLLIYDGGELSEIDLKLKCVNFNMAVFGENCGIYKIAGQAQNCSLHLEGSAHFLTDELAVDSAYVHHNGIGDCFVNATRKLSGKILLDGILKYKNYKGLEVNIQNQRGQLIAM